MKAFIKLAKTDVSYNGEAKADFHRQGKTVLRRLAKALGYTNKDFDLRSNMGGIAVSGEITLHSDTLYVQLAQSAFGDRSRFMWRTCRGRKDYTGNANQWASFDDLNDLNALAKVMLAAVKG